MVVELVGADGGGVVDVAVAAAIGVEVGLGDGVGAGVGEGLTDFEHTVGGAGLRRPGQ